MIVPVNTRPVNSGEIPLSTSQAKRYSKILKQTISDDAEQTKEAIDFVQRWRARYAPATRQCFQTLLECCKGVDGAIITYRLKRVSSIVQKIQRPNHNHLLNTLDDIGGCRVITKSIKDLRLIQKRIEDKIAGTSSEITKTKDYIDSPKSSGYRSCHLLTKQGSCERKYRVEIQLRTQLQHYWATALEVIDEIEGREIKTTNTDVLLGDADTRTRLYYNQLTSSLIAGIEESPTVPGTPKNIDDLVSEIETLPLSSEIISRLSRVYDDVLRLDEKHCAPEDACVFILQFLKDEQNLIVHSYANNQMDESLSEYSRLEDEVSENNKNGLIAPNQNIVLVHVNDPEQLKVAYPNYSANIKEYLKLITQNCPALDN